MKKLLAFLLVFVLLMASSVSAEQEIKFRDAEWMGGLYDTLSAVFVDDYRIMLPGGERIGDTDASTYVYVFQTSVRTVLGNKDENRKCLLANEFSIDLGEVTGIPLSSINLYFLFDETNPDYVGETEDAKFFMAEYVFDADESAMAELEKTGLFVCFLQKNRCTAIRSHQFTGWYSLKDGTYGNGLGKSNRRCRTYAVCRQTNGHVLVRLHRV